MTGIATQTPATWCRACQQDTATDATCPFCASIVDDSNTCLVCREPVSPLNVCHACEAPRDDADELGLLRLEVKRLARLNELNANTVQSYRTVFACLSSHLTFALAHTLQKACRDAGADYRKIVLGGR